MGISNHHHAGEALLGKLRAAGGFVGLAVHGHLVDRHLWGSSQPHSLVAACALGIIGATSQQGQGVLVTGRAPWCHVQDWHSVHSTQSGFRREETGAESAVSCHLLKWHRSGCLGDVCVGEALPAPSPGH